MNNQVGRKKDVVAVSDEYGNISIAETDEKGLLLENKVAAIDEIINKLEHSLQLIAAERKSSICISIIPIICSIIIWLNFVLPYNMILLILGWLAFLVGCASLGGILSMIIYFLTSPKRKELEKDLEKAEEIKQERVQELKEYLEKAKEITPVEEEYIVSLKEDYDEDITELKEQFASLAPQKQMSRTRRRQGK